MNIKKTTGIHPVKVIQLQVQLQQNK